MKPDTNRPNAPMILFRFISLSLALFLDVDPLILSAQTDSIVIVCPRVGCWIDYRERTYFGVFSSVPKQDQVVIKRVFTDTGTVFEVSSTNPRWKSVAVDSLYVANLARSINFKEAIDLLPPSDVETKIPDRDEGSVAEIAIDNATHLNGELLFADIHGIVVRDADVISGKSGYVVVPASQVRSIGIRREFGAGTFVMMKIGLITGIGIFGIAGAVGGDTEAGEGLAASALLSSGGAVLGLLYDLIVSAAGNRMLLRKGGAWDPPVVKLIQNESRFPAGTPELKLLLAKFDNDDEWRGLP